MTDQKNFPAKNNQHVAVHAGQRGSLVMRGLVAVRENKELALTMDNDALYKHVRSVFDQNCGIDYWSESSNPSLFAAFKIFQQLANETYEKAYYPLSVLYRTSQHDENGQNQAQHFAQLSLDWCFANPTKQNVELWCDLGDLYRWMDSSDGKVKLTPSA